MILGDPCEKVVQPLKGAMSPRLRATDLKKIF